VTPEAPIKYYSDSPTPHLKHTYTKKLSDKLFVLEQVEVINEEENEAKDKNIEHSIKDDNILYKFREAKHDDDIDENHMEENEEKANQIVANKILNTEIIIEQDPNEALEHKDTQNIVIPNENL